MRKGTWLSTVALRALKTTNHLGRQHGAFRYLEHLETRLLLSSSIPLNTSSWTALGPSPIASFSLDRSGRITGIAADLTSGNSNTIYVTAADGGVWKTTNAGGSWAALTDNQSS